MTESSSIKLFSALLRDRRRRDKARLGGKPRWVNKLAWREFAESKGCRVPALYAAVDSSEDLPSFDRLPSAFVIKHIRGSESKRVVPIRDGVNLFDGESWDRDRVVRFFSRYSRRGAAEGKQILVEEMMINWDHRPGVPFDFKFHMFGKRVAFISICDRNHDPHEQPWWYRDEHWNRINSDIYYKKYLERTGELVKPPCFEELKEMAVTLGGELNRFIRVDLYATTKGAVFGEFTSNPNRGTGFSSWADRWLGDMWQGANGYE